MTSLKRPYGSSVTSRPSPTAAWLTGIVVILLLIAGCSLDSETAPSIKLMRTPNGGIQPMAEVDETGTVHLIYFRGEPAAGDVYYVRKESGDESFAEPVRVNSEPNSVIATGTVRGAHLAVGENGRAHVAWMGSSEATPRGPDDAAPMLYAHSRNDGREFTEQRNVLQHTTGSMVGERLRPTGAETSMCSGTPADLTPMGSPSGACGWQPLRQRHVVRV